MAANLGRWLKYAQAKLNGAVSSSNDELDQLEAEQAAKAADKPWLSSDSDAPTLEEAKARIEWEAEEARRQVESVEANTPKAPSPAPPTDSTSTDRPGSSATPAAEPVDPEERAARIELDRREREGKERLEAIRKELGVDPPDPKA